MRILRELIEEIFPVTAADISEACELLSNHPALDARDAVHAAVAKRNHISLIVSADHALEKIRGLHRVSASQVVG